MLDARAIRPIRARIGPLRHAIAARLDPNDGHSSFDAAARRVMQRMLSQYVALLEHALTSVTLSHGEARALAGAYSSFPFADLEGDAFIDAVAEMPQRVRVAADRCPVALRETFETLQQTVDSWTMMQRAAVLDALHRLWNRLAESDDCDIDALLKQIGLIQCEGAARSSTPAESSHDEAAAQLPSSSPRRHTEGVARAVPGRCGASRMTRARDAVPESQS